MTTTRESLARHLRKLWLPFLGACLAGILHSGCSDPASPPPPPPQPTGALSVVIADLPTGTDADVTVNGAQSFVRHITASTIIDGVPEGSCSIDASPVEIAPGDTIYPVPATQTTTVVADDTVTVQLVYEAAAATSITVFHGPVVFGGAHVMATYVLLEDYGGPTTGLNETDLFSFPYPDDYILGPGCEIIGTDVTASGVAIATSISSEFGTGTATGNLVVENGGATIHITGSASAEATPIGAYVGSGSTVGGLTLGYPGQYLHDLSVAIANPGGGAYEVQFTWSYTGSETGGDFAGWKQYFTYQVDPQVCDTNPAPEFLFEGNDFAGGPASDSGTYSISLSGPFHLISFGLRSEAFSVWAMDHLQRGGYGSAQSSSEVSIDIIR